MEDLLKFITCGSVDDGKSTLIGRMLYDAKLIFTDQKLALELDSKLGIGSGEIDYSLMLDGLMAEREQGITIDVAYRYFTTTNRSYIVADCPGHEQYTRNMAVGASFAELAVILIDATQGVLLQTKRHARICSMMGIKDFVVAINKMDLIYFNKERFDTINDDLLELFSHIDTNTLQIIPVSATTGDNINSKSIKSPWYDGLSFLEYLDQFSINRKFNNEELVLPVQLVSRPNSSFRGFQGQIESGIVSVGDEITVLPTNEKSIISELYVTDQKVKSAFKGQPVTVCFEREIDVSRGSVICKNSSVEVSDLFSGNILWMDNLKLVAGRSYFLKCGTKIVPATIIKIKHKLDINTGKKFQSDELYLNELGNVEISLGESIVLDSFDKLNALGSFILIDRVTNMTSAWGVIQHKLDRSGNVHWQEFEISKKFRSTQKNQTPMTIWFTGLSGSGKSSIANAVEKSLVNLDKHTMLLDGDNVRLGLNKELGFNEKDRIENIRRIAEVSKLMNDAGLITLCSFISPYEKDRNNAKRIVGEQFIEVYVSTSLEVCESRDVKGLYSKAKSGEIKNFTGVSAPYEVPTNPNITIDTEKLSIDQAASIIVDYIKNI